MQNIEYFEHLTIETGHMMRQYRDEGSATAYEFCFGLVEQIAAGKEASIIDGYAIHGVVTKNMLSGVIFKEGDENQTPLIRTMIVTDSLRSKKYWPSISDTEDFSACPAAPWIATRYSGAAGIGDFDLLAWSGSFWPCLAWGWEDWKKLRKI